MMSWGARLRYAPQQTYAWSEATQHLLQESRSSNLC